MVKAIRVEPRYLWLLTLAFLLVYIAANWFDARLIKILNFNTGAGALIFPLTYLLADIITEVYGYKNARRVIWLGLLFNLLFLLYGYLIYFLPTPNINEQTIFNQFLYQGTRVIFASIISYLVTESFNSYLLAKLKLLLTGKYLGIRFLICLLITHTIDAITFCPIAFYGIIGNQQLYLFILQSWAIMTSMELILLPFAIRIAKIIKRYEQLDIYDEATNFNVFKLETDYSSQDNKFNVGSKN